MLLIIYTNGNFINRKGGLATASDLAAFWLSMIDPVKKSANHSRTGEHERIWLGTTTILTTRSLASHAGIFRGARFSSLKNKLP